MKQTPEDKLLQLIKGQKRSSPAPAAEETHLPDHVQTTGIHPRSGLDLSWLYTPVFALRFLVVISVGFFVFSLLGSLMIREPDAISQMSKPGNQEDKNITLDIKPYDYYAQATSGRQIFAGGTSVSSALVPAQIDAEAVKDINLVAVMTGDNPQAVIEDKKTQKTYYLSQGQIFGDLRVEQIQEGKVTLSRGGKKIELHL